MRVPRFPKTVLIAGLIAAVSFGGLVYSYFWAKSLDERVKTLSGIAARSSCLLKAEETCDNGSCWPDEGKNQPIEI